jgi:hypothetical protein
MPIVPILVTLLLLALVVWAVRTLTPALGIPEPIATVIYVIVVVLVVLYLIGLLGGPAYLRWT